jgi:hypothetical protein
MLHFNSRQFCHFSNFISTVYSISSMGKNIILSIEQRGMIFFHFLNDGQHEGFPDKLGFILDSIL